MSAVPDRLRRAALVVAVVTWATMLLVLALSATGAFARGEIEGHTYGQNPDGLAGAFSRVVDTLSYFTVWSNLAVALVFTLVALRPTRSLLQRVLLLDALLMITITTIVYWALLAGGENWSGWTLLTSPLQHAVVGVLTIGVWFAVGPVGWLDWKAAPLAAALPLLWVGYVLVRGEVVSAYPYGFTDVITHGYPAVLTTLAMVLVLGLVIAALFVAVDRRRARTVGSDS